jgi:hypothetical protein
VIRFQAPLSGEAEERVAGVASPVSLHRHAIYAIVHSLLNFFYKDIKMLIFLVLDL